MTKKFRLKVYRGVPGSQYWETYELEERTGLNIVSALMILQRNPVTIDGRRVTPIAYESGCLENVCGSCSMLINGYPKQACAALVRQIIETTKNPEITLAPFTKFPLIRDLMIDRSAMFENLKAISGWIEADATWDHGPGPKITPHEQEVRYVLSTCMTCGCCSEGCPQVNAHSDFMGPAPISQARLFNAHPTGHTEKAKRLHALMGEDGVNACGNAQNCREVCPKKIPLTESIAVIYRDVTKQSFRDMFSPVDRET